MIKHMIVWRNAERKPPLKIAQRKNIQRKNENQQSTSISVIQWTKENLGSQSIMWSKINGNTTHEKVKSDHN